MSYMKKSFIPIVVLLCCIGIDANAQVPHFGAKVGLNLSDVYGFEMPPDFGFKKELRTGLVVGAYLTYDFLPLLSIQPEVLYSMKGFGSSVALPVAADYLFAYNYVEVPVLLKLNLPVGSPAPFKANVFVGPDFAFNVAGYERITVNPGHTSTFDQESSTRSFDFNVAVGAGAAYDVGPTTLGLELRHTFGTGRINKSGTADYRNGVLAAMASVGI